MQTMMAQMWSHFTSQAALSQVTEVQVAQLALLVRLVMMPLLAWQHPDRREQGVCRPGTCETPLTCSMVFNVNWAATPTQRFSCAAQEREDSLRDLQLTFRTR